MVKFYHNDIPALNDLVVVEIIDFEKSDDNFNIKCKLLEYDNMIGMISKFNVNRKTTNVIKSHKIGSILIATFNEINNSIADLHYISQNDVQLKKYMDDYVLYSKIINTLLHISSDIISDVFNNLIWKFDKETILDMFYVHLDKLYDFVFKLYGQPTLDIFKKYFKKKDKTFDIPFTVQSFNCLGIDYIKKYINDVDKLLTSIIGIKYTILLDILPNFIIRITTNMFDDDIAKDKFSQDILYNISKIQ